MANAWYNDGLEMVAAGRMEQYTREAEVDHLASQMNPGGSSWWWRQVQQGLPSLVNSVASLGVWFKNPGGESAGSIRQQPAS